MFDGMGKVEKVTISLPAELLRRIEDRRHNQGASRSEVVSELLWRGWRQVEANDRERRYRAAYQAEPENDEERAWAESAAADLLGEDDAAWGTADHDATS